MTKGEIVKTILKTTIEWIVYKSLPCFLLSFLGMLLTSYFSITNKLIEHPFALLVLFITMTTTTILFFILWIRNYWRYERFQEAFGVLWDKEYRMRCLACRKPLKKSTLGTSIFFCSDPNCNSKHVLRKDDGSLLTEEAAKFYLKHPSSEEAKMKYARMFNMTWNEQKKSKSTIVKMVR